MNASTVQAAGAFGFGALIGWFVYFVNRYRSAGVQLSDVAGLVGVIGGGAVLTLFPEQTDLFGWYGVGLAVGFFGYFLVLVALVLRSPQFDLDWFLDGRRRTLPEGWEIPQGTAQTVHPMGPREGPRLPG